MKKRLTFVPTISKNYYWCYNQQQEILGKIYLHKNWKRFVWEQQKGIIMSRSCLKEVIEFMETLGGRG